MSGFSDCWVPCVTGPTEEVYEVDPYAEYAPQRPVSRAWWSRFVCCARVEAVPSRGAESELVKFYQNTSGTSDKWIKLTTLRISQPPERALRKYLNSCIRAFTELRSAFWSLQPQSWITYHAFTIMEAREGAETLYILCERKSDKLEIMFGEGEVPLFFMKEMRALGTARGRDGYSEQPRQALSSMVTVKELLDWLDGPVARSWQPYSLVSANCQHLADDLQRFLMAPGAARRGMLQERQGAMAAIYADPGAVQPLKYVPEASRRDRAVVLEAVAQNGCALQDASAELRDDPEVVLTAVHASGEALQFASEELRADREVVLAAVRQSGQAVQFAAEGLRRDRQFLLAAVGQNGLALRYAAEELRGDGEVVLTAVRQNGYALLYASNALKHNRHFVLAAVGQGGLALRYASPELQADREVVLAAVRQNGYALQYAASELQRDAEFARGALKRNGLALRFLPDSLRRDQPLILEAVRQSGGALQFVPQERRTPEVVFAALKQNGQVLEHAGAEFQRDRLVVLAAVCQNGLALRYASEELRSDREVVLAAVRTTGDALQYASKDLRQDWEVVLAASWHAPEALLQHAFGM